MKIINMSADRGFTLIETMLGLMIFAVLAASLYSVFHGGVRLDQRSSGINKINHELRMGFEAMTRDLENTFVYDFSGSYPKQKSLTGTADQLTFLAATDSGIKAVSYYLGRPDFGHITKTVIGRHVTSLRSVVTNSQKESPYIFLLRCEQDFASFLNNKKEGREEEILMSFVQKGGLKFHYAKAKDRSWEWQDDWQEVQLPKAVAIEVVLVDPDDMYKTLTMRRDVAIPVSVGTQDAK